MCPLWPLHIIIFYLLTLLPFWAVCQVAPRMMADYIPEKLEIHMDSTEKVLVNITDFEGCKSGDEIFMQSLNSHISDNDFAYYKITPDDLNKAFLPLKFNVSGNFLGNINFHLLR